MPLPEFTNHPDRKGIFQLSAVQAIPRPIDEVFAFFSDARNLEKITPAWMNFHVLTLEPINMHAGQQIDYRLRVHGVPLTWQSEITVWEPPFRFVDEQRRGPYRLWHHEHTFEDEGSSTLVRDRVDYAVPGGRLINSLFVRRDLRAIFRYRTKRLAQIFGDTPSQPDA